MKLRRFLAATCAAVLCISAIGMTNAGSNILTDNVSITAGAEDELTYGDFSYEIQDDGTIVITHYSGQKTSVTFPSEINGKKVTAIGGGFGNWYSSYVAVFTYENDNVVTSITIPEGVKRIGHWAFAYHCDNLENVTIPKSVEYIGREAFGDGNYNDTVWLKNMRKKNPLVIVNNCLIDAKTCSGAVTIPEGVTYIDSVVFSGNNNITSVSVPSTVTSIEKGAFWNKCSKLEAINVSEKNKNYASENGVLLNKDKTTLLQYPVGKAAVNYQVPSTVFLINDGAFEGSKIISLKIPSNVKSIRGWAFRNCKDLRSVTIKDGVLNISNHMFSGCSSLTSVTMPDTVEVIGVGSFKDCTSLKKIVLSPNITSIESYAFQGCNSLESIELPSKLTEISESLFCDCEKLSTIKIPAGVKKIGNRAFYNCKALKAITLPSKLTEISGYLFSGCENIKTITIPDSVSKIDDGAFENCTALETITLPSKLTDIGGGVFTGTKWLEAKRKSDPMVIVNGILIDGSQCKGKVVIPDTVEKIADVAFVDYNENYENTTAITDVTIPASVKYIGSSAFYKAPALTSVTIKGASHVGSQAFAYCNALKKVFIGKNTFDENPLDEYYEGSEIFYECNSLTDVTIENGVKIIPSGTFEYCDLRSVKIPDSVQSIGESAFANNENLSNVTIGKNVSYIDQWAFSDTAWYDNIAEQNKPVIVGDGCLLYGGRMDGKVVIPNNVKTIVYGSIELGDNVTEVVFPNSVTSIDLSMFSNLNKLRSITLGKNVTKIEGVLYGCDNFTTINIPDSVKEIGMGAFWSCSNLTNVDIDTSIERYSYSSLGTKTHWITAFDRTPWRDSFIKTIDDPSFGLIIENNVLIDGHGSFGDVVVPDGVTEIADGAFYARQDPHNVKTITIPSSVKRIGEYAFSELGAEKIFLSEGLEEIGQWAFNGLGRVMEDITIPNSVKIIGRFAYGFPSDAGRYNYQEDTHINCYAGSAAEKYALMYGLDYSIHKWDSGVVTKKATCKVTGVKTFTCTECGAKKTSTIAKTTSHKYDSGKVTKAATYAAAGTKTYTCKVCGAKKTSSIAKKTVKKLTAKTTYTCTTNAVRINWNKLSGVTGYKIFRYDDAKKKWVAVKAIYNPNTTNYKISGLKAGKVYKFRVKAFVKENNKFYFGESCSTISTATRPNTTTVTKANKTSSAVRLFWKKTTCTGYRILRYDSATKKWVRVTAVGSSATTQYKISGLKKNTTYKFKVQPYVKVGSKVIDGAASAVFTIKTAK